MTIAFGAFLFRTEIEKLKEENVKLQEQLDVYEIRKEQMHMQVIWRLFCWEFIAVKCSLTNLRFTSVSRVTLASCVTLLLCFRQFVSAAR